MDPHRTGSSQISTNIYVSLSDVMAKSTFYIYNNYRSVQTIERRMASLNVAVLG